MRRAFMFEIRLKRLASAHPRLADVSPSLLSIDFHARHIDYFVFMASAHIKMNRKDKREET